MSTRRSAGDESSWEHARLIPVFGVKKENAEQERRVASATLAVMSVVEEFGRAVVDEMNAPAGRMSTYTEVPFDIGGRPSQVDGVIRVYRRGDKVWTALVEVKTRHNCLDAEQLNRYLDVAHKKKYDALLTISNEFESVEGFHPTDVSKRKLRGIKLRHLSWAEVLSKATVLKTRHGIADTEQRWILDELIRYLKHENSGALEFCDMGAHWTSVRDKLQVRGAMPSEEQLADVAARLDSLTIFAALKRSEAGMSTKVLLPKDEVSDFVRHANNRVAQLNTESKFSVTFKTAGVQNLIRLEIDFKSQRLCIRTDVDATSETRPVTRVKRLLRKFHAVPPQVAVESFASYGRTAVGSTTFGQLRDNPDLLCPNRKSDLRSFRIKWSSSMGTTRRGKDDGFAESVLDLVRDFYEVVVAELKESDGKVAKPAPKPQAMIQSSAATVLPTSSALSTDPTVSSSSTATALNDQ
jgi:hypothetical protein